MKIIIFDDDPTGSQSVYGCPLLLNWDYQTLKKGIEDNSRLLFLLANTRAMTPQNAEERTRKICRSFKNMVKIKGFKIEDFLFVSRGDSTLRGHGVMEPEIINEELGPFDATFHAPAFFEGGRTTIDGIHLLNGNPVHLTNFALDSTFGYSTSYLPDWIEEKSNGTILANNVCRISCHHLNAAIQSNNALEELLKRLKTFSNNVSVVVDAQNPDQLEIFAKAVIQLMGQKRFLFRSAASLISAFAQLPENSLTSSKLAALRIRDQSLRLKSGLVMVGSHVQLADQQLDILLKEPNCEGVELPVEKINRILEETSRDHLLNNLEFLLSKKLQSILDSRKTPVLYTSRGEISFPSVSKRMFFGLQLAELMSRLAVTISSQIGYVISKGGITTQIFLEKGLGLEIVKLKGQIMPGLSIVCPYNNEKFKPIPIITFPGNLGNQETLLKVWKLMENQV
tara:strand:- start:58827 stop:60185 length:1359 start_codon:yes stop_codon:yes gene_type:complete